MSLRLFPGLRPDRTSPVRGGAIALVAGRGLNALCGIVQVPLAMQALGVEAFGLWSALTGFLWTIAILDGGFGYALQNRLARLLADGREVEALALGRKGRRVLWQIAAVVALPGLPLCFLLPWADWLAVQGLALREQTPAALAVTLALGSSMIPLGLSARVAAARQETWLTGIWTGAGSLTSLATVMVAAMLSAPLPAFVLASGVLPLTLYLGQAWQLARRSPSERPEKAGLSPNLHGIGRESALFFLPQVSAAFVSAFVPMLVAFFAGSGAVAAFSVVQRLFGLVLQFTALMLQPTWPAYTHAAARGDLPKARRLYVSSLWLSFAAAGATLALVPLTPAILRVWLGGKVPPLDSTLVWVVAGWNALQCLGQPPAMVLNGLGRNDSLAWLSWIVPSVALALCFWLGPSHGAAGVAGALAIPYLLANLPIVHWQARRAVLSASTWSGHP